MQPDKKQWQNNEIALALLIIIQQRLNAAFSLWRARQTKGENKFSSSQHRSAKQGVIWAQMMHASRKLQKRCARRLRSDAPKLTKKICTISVIRT